MPNKKDDFEVSDLLLIIGGIWILTKLFKTPIQAGIGGLPNSERKLKSYISKLGVQEFKNDLLNFDRNEQGELIRMIIEARLRKELSMPFFKTLKGTKLSAELRQNQWRIIIYVINNEEYLMLSAFKKKTDETPKNEIDKAERRLKEYLSR
jgi:phage-related protein